GSDRQRPGPGRGGRLVSDLDLGGHAARWLLDGAGMHEVRHRGPVGLTVEQCPHDASVERVVEGLVTGVRLPQRGKPAIARFEAPKDRKSTRLNSSHITISYAVFFL